MNMIGISSGECGCDKIIVIGKIMLMQLQKQSMIGTYDEEAMQNYKHPHQSCYATCQ